MRKIIALLCLISIVGFSIGFYLLNFYECGISVFCYDLTTKAYALYYGMGALSLVFFFLLLLPGSFHSWKIFGMWFIPVAILIFAYQDDKGNGFMEISLSSVQVFQWISTLYVVISLIIIAFSLYKSQNKNKK